jgi:hypothetical protein
MASHKKKETSNNINCLLNIIRLFSLSNTDTKFLHITFAFVDIKKAKKNKTDFITFIESYLIADKKHTHTERENVTALTKEKKLNAKFHIENSALV